ncbi:GNAT family N-acetyltransferase [Psychroserpens sp.]|uniref:GNAT family N-acetyltransferase n=1 Tax=Psychroserpens sp. TaxID=2020870 RepID=UPI002B26C44C|nr:GNAT family N-acetyltransferase [Psychroserpens sp.]
MSFVIRVATEDDIPVILELIIELAVYENEPDAVSISVEDLKTYGFNNNPRFHCFVGEVNGVVQGMALTYERFSTWKGPVLHLEDLIVSQKMRGSGLGTALLDEVVAYGNQLGVKRITWVVLNWNTSAIEFYKKKGAKIDSEWDSVNLDEVGIKNYLSKI